MKQSTAIILVAASLLGRVVAAEPARRLEIGAMTGGHFFAHDLELGVADQQGMDTPASAALVGVRLGWWLSTRLELEGEVVAIPTEDRMHGQQATVYGWRGHALVELLRTGPIRPYLVAGVGALELAHQATALQDDIDLTYHWGGGARIGLGRALDLRLDARHLVAPDVHHNGATSDVELTVGVAWRFGGQPAVRAPRLARAVPAPVSPPPRDPDGDGLIAPTDQCPDQAEDRDGFADGDGCPDPDNDVDGLVDELDRCPDVAETANGFQDDDGCPDETIEELVGIQFERSSARITPGSRPILDRAVALLRAHAELRLEIEGHTSSEGDRARNLALSQARADAVRAYLEAHGIATARLTSTGLGPDRPIADNRSHEGRSQNRRIEFHIVH